MSNLLYALGGFCSALALERLTPGSGAVPWWLWALFAALAFFMGWAIAVTREVDLGKRP